MYILTRKRHWCLYIDKKETEEKVVQSAGALRPLWPLAIFFEGHKAKLRGNDVHDLPEIPPLSVTQLNIQVHDVRPLDMMFKYASWT